jgi:DNA repair photolyase
MANSHSIKQKIERALGDSVIKPSVIDQFIKARQPIHFGGMSDPFMSFEEENDITYNLLRNLAEFDYPTIISTKSDKIAEEKYLSILKDKNFLVQFSIISTDEDLLRNIDIGTPGPKRLLAAAKKLASEGINVAARIQPVLPGIESHAFNVMDACKENGIKHVAVEHLKLPIESKWSGNRELSRILNIDLVDFYQKSGSKRIGREWVLPVSYRLWKIIEFRKYAHAIGLTFGAADNDLLLFSDGNCCCSGADLFSGFDSYFKYNFAQAAKYGVQNEQINLNTLDSIWCPEGSISRYMNSHSRIPPVNKVSGGLKDYIKRNWNGSTNGNSPLQIYGVQETGLKDNNGFNVYKLDSQVRVLLST